MYVLYVISTVVLKLMLIDSKTHFFPPDTPRTFICVTFKTFGQPANIV